MPRRRSAAATEYKQLLHTRRLRNAGDSPYPVPATNLGRTIRRNAGNASPSVKWVKAKSEKFIGSFGGLPRSLLLFLGVECPPSAGRILVIDFDLQTQPQRRNAF